MRVKSWGVRSSIPSPGPLTCRYGESTTCIEVRGKEGEFIVQDAGTGIRALGLDLLNQGDSMGTGRSHFPGLRLTAIHLRKAEQ